MFQIFGPGCKYELASSDDFTGFSVIVEKKGDCDDGKCFKTVQIFLSSSSKIITVNEDDTVTLSGTEFGATPIEGTWL